MDEPLTVGCVEGAGDVLRTAERLGDRHRGSLEPCRQSLAVEQRHHEVERARLFADVEQRTNVRMIERRDAAGLTLKALTGGRIDSEFRRQHLDGHGPLQSRVASLVHLPHAARSKRAGNLVRPESGARRQAHGA